jgi:hypothetical protein
VIYFLEVVRTTMIGSHLFDPEEIRAWITSIISLPAVNPNDFIAVTAAREGLR